VREGRRGAIVELEEKLKTLITKQLAVGWGAEALDEDEDLRRVLDSTGMLELIVWVESNFGFTVEPDDVVPDNFGTIRKLSSWLRARSGTAVGSVHASP
jgi:acyl carrier protein